MDDLTVTGIRLQFAYITRHDTSDSDTKVIDDKIVFHELASQGRIAQTDPEGPTKLVDLGSGITYPIERVDMTAADGGFSEWKEKFWWAKVYDGKSYGEYVRLATDKVGNRAPDITKVVNQSLYGATPRRRRAPRPRDAAPRRAAAYAAQLPPLCLRHRP